MLFHNDDAFAAMLLTLRLPMESGITPLRPREYHSLCKKAGRPGKLLGMSMESVRSMLKLNEAESYRLTALLGRTTPLSLLLDSCNNAAVEMVAISEDEYPARLKKRLGMEAPPVLFCCGDLSLLRERGAAALGVSARRDFADDAGQFVRRATESRMVVYTDGSDGLGSELEDAAVRENGRVISFLADPLWDRVSRPGFGEMIAARRALAISTREPEAIFDRERARERSLCLCALTDFSALLCLERTEGPLWEAASTAHGSKNMSRLYVRAEDRLEGNMALLAKGAMPFHDICELPFSRPEIADGEQLSFLI